MFKVKDVNIEEYYTIRRFTDIDIGSISGVMFAPNLVFSSKISTRFWKRKRHY